MVTQKTLILQAMPVIQASHVSGTPPLNECTTTLFASYQKHSTEALPSADSPVNEQLSIPIA